MQNSTNSIILNTDIILDGVSTIFLEKVSSEVIFLRPPENLVIEVKATGLYRSIQWTKDGTLMTHLQPQQFPNYNEILVYGTTTQDDLGLYEVSVHIANPFQRLVPTELDFIVVSPGKFY